ncbi:single-stranded DNA-binding protein [Patulibacter brassicae]|uniref:Single-stranded DNA-binding protein n=1 Tax=Patulibacter brassicae TaxID=1705717 RepID=A0ABU4VNG4_9ACTN|nr:single-stranded DNA-binding protein [Patulibacter brassicae]MDX8153400.1 single-stranded DNA-binding protein [Patulibacter brassicae]
MQSNTTISGYLGQTPEVRETPGGHKVATVRVAVNDRRLSDQALWFSVDQWDDAAERAAKFLVKGQHVVAEGLQRAEIYTDRHGQPRLDLRLLRAYIDYGPRPTSTEATASPQDAPPEPATSAPAKRKPRKTEPAPVAA